MTSTLQSYITQVQSLINDFSGTLFSQGQYTNFVNAARQRVTLDTHCARYLFTNLNTIAQQETYVYNNTVAGLNLISGGSGYSAPTISFSGGGGTGAAATAVVTAGVITQVNMTNWGSGYTSAPTVTINDGTGTGASATANLLSNILDIMNISILWGSERLTMCWLEFTRFNAFCRSFTSTFARPGVMSFYQPMNTFYLYPIPDQAYGMEIDAIQQSSALTSLSQVDAQIQAPYDDAVQFYAAFLALASIQDARAPQWYSGNGSGIYETRIKQFPAQSFERRIFNPYLSGLPRVRKV